MTVTGKQSIPLTGHGGWLIQQPINGKIRRITGMVGLFPHSNFHTSWLYVLKRYAPACHRDKIDNEEKK